MKKVYQDSLKRFFRAQLLVARAEMGLTQAQMARKLAVEERSYAALESGSSCCGALTLARFLVYCCKDPLAFLAGLRAALEGAEQNAA